MIISDQRTSGQSKQSLRSQTSQNATVFPTITITMNTDVPQTVDECTKALLKCKRDVLYRYFHIPNSW